MQEKIRNLIQESIDVKQSLLAQEQIDVLEKIAKLIIQAYNTNKKLIVFGNGGSASDAQHLAAELVCRFEKNRAALPAIALTANASVLTATGNDFGFDDVFKRQVEALCQPADVVLGISTSGNSENVIKAIETAQKIKAVTIGFTGAKGGRLKDKVDVCFCAPSQVTGRIQECHIMAIHILCSLAEDALFEEK